MKNYAKLLIPLLCIAFTLGIFRTVFFIGYVPSESMEPTLKQGSVIIGIRTFSDIQVGDIIVFEHDRKLMVKRVAAVEGNPIFINDTEKPVPANSYYVLGDNADNSYDSRFWPSPFVDRKDVIAKVLH